MQNNSQRKDFSENNLRGEQRNIQQANVRNFFDERFTATFNLKNYEPHHCGSSVLGDKPPQIFTSKCGLCSFRKKRKCVFLFSEPKSKNRLKSASIVLAIFLSTTLILSLTQAYVIKLYVVPSSSMAPLLNAASDSEIADRILVDRLAYHSSNPAQGDVVVFRKNQQWSNLEPHGSEQTSGWKLIIRNISEFVGVGPGAGGILVKRIIAGPGDVVSCCNANGEIQVNGISISEPYVETGFPHNQETKNCIDNEKSLRCFGEITVPPDSFLVLGDNRMNSSDSLANCRRQENAAPDCVRFVNKTDLIGQVFGVIDIPSRPLFFL